MTAAIENAALLGVVHRWDCDGGGGAAAADGGGGVGGGSGGGVVILYITTAQVRDADQRCGPAHERMS